MPSHLPSSPSPTARKALSLVANVFPLFLRNCASSAHEVRALDKNSHPLLLRLLWDPPISLVPIVFRSELSAPSIRRQNTSAPSLFSPLSYSHLVLLYLLSFLFPSSYFSGTFRMGLEASLGHPSPHRPTVFPPSPSSFLRVIFYVIAATTMSLGVFSWFQLFLTSYFLSLLPSFPFAFILFPSFLCL